MNCTRHAWECMIYFKICEIIVWSIFVRFKNQVMYKKKCFAINFYNIDVNKNIQELKNCITMYVRVP